MEIMEDNKSRIDVYYTIENRVRTEIKVKGSKFVATAESVPDKEAALFLLESVRSEFYKATHNCFAYRFGFDGMEFRSSDDREPSGCAGKPILFAIKKFEFSDIIVVVTRFFGGTKLGIGGLARAYSEAVNTTLTKCVKKPVYRTTMVRVFCTYEDVSPVKKLIDEFAISFKDEYADAVEFVADIPLSQVDTFCAKITSATRGRAGTVVREE